MSALQHVVLIAGAIVVVALAALGFFFILIAGQHSRRESEFEDTAGSVQGQPDGLSEQQAARAGSATKNRAA